ncbi:hypothetical protein EGH21_01795 [Halomicroarcula sp. F13]|uniref:Secreted protein n=1 Tax=Haloarcula rubra TaxID=2487747 RepID=A0AAW4PMG6_9EURY|nr:hypothetical protein [Halomicroarcula rubra]MBX0321755.1 hypothetical protein [Halomicroarcula rubra]
MYPLLQGPGVGGLVVVFLLLLAMVVPVLVVLGIALYLTRDQWDDRKDVVGTPADPTVDADETPPEDQRADDESA